jgi:hypothetical protein
MAAPLPKGGLLFYFGGRLPFHTELSPYELTLLPKALSFAQGLAASEGVDPTQDQIQRHVHCARQSAKNLQHFLVETKAVTVAGKLEDAHDKAVTKAVLQTAAGDKPYGSTEEYALRENARLTRQLAKVKVELTAERSMRQHLSLNHAGYDDLLAHVKEFVDVLGDFRSPVSPVKAQKQLVSPPVKEGHTEDAMLVISDCHFGDIIRSDDTSGFPEYDLEIAGNRMGYLAKKTKMILGLHRAMYPIKKLYVPILGDIGNGDLHDAPKSNALFIPAQIHFSYHMIRFLLEDLAQLIEEGIIEEIVLCFSVGNHMRMAEDKNMPTKLQAQRTFDWLIYQFVIERFKGVKGFTIHETMSPYIFENIRGHRIGFNHGMEVGYKNSPEAQVKSMSSFVNHVRALFDSPVFRETHGFTGSTFDRFVIGDIHVPVSFPRVLSNGSFNGQNELGVNWGLECIPASQWLCGISDKQIQTWQYLIDFTHVQRQEPNGYCEFAKDYQDRFGR